MSTRSPKQLYAGIALSAAGALILEIGLTRIFSYTIWYHFAYLTISIALLGFGASGSFLTAFPQIGAKKNFLSWSAITAQLGIAGCLLVTSRVQLDPLSVATDPSQIARLTLYYLAVALPFFAGGLCVVGALQAMPRQVSRLYFWDLVGAGIGCGLVVPLIWAIGTPLATTVATLAFAGAACSYAETRTRLRQGVIAIGLAIGALGLAHTSTFTAAPTKLLSQYLESPTARIAFSNWNPVNRVDVVAFDPAPRTGSYQGWGISSHYEGEAPGFYMIGNDGDSCAVMYNWDGDPESIDFLRHHVLHVPYLLLDRPKVVAIGLGGGVDVLNALLNGAESVTGVEINPQTVYAGKSVFSEFNGNLLNRPGVEAVTSEGRSFLRTRDARYDLVEINSVDTLAALNSGAYVLSESYLYTSDAVAEYLDHLEPGGIFAMVVGDVRTPSEPPRHTFRLASVVRRALESRGVTDPARHVMIVGSRGPLPMTHTLVKNEPFSADEIRTVAEYLQEEGFRFWHRPDRMVDDGAARILTSSPADLEWFYDHFPLNVRATSDESPFFFNFYRWSALLDPAVYANLGHERTSATGQIILVIMLFQSIFFGLVLIVLPLRFLPRKQSGSRGRKAYLAYFSALGAGFILLEISLIQRFVLFLGYPTYALTVVLLSLLIFSGAGSYLTNRVHDRFERALPPRLLALLILGAAYLIGLPVLFDALLALPLAVRVIVAIALLAPLGLVLGGFFPLGVRFVEERDPQLVPWAWAINGCTTVVGTVLAVMIGMTWSFTVVTLLAMGVYAGGVVSLVLSARSPVRAED